MASTQKEAHSGISTSRSSYFSLVRTSLDGGARARIDSARGWLASFPGQHNEASGWPAVTARACARAHHEVVIGREIKRRENLVFTESSTIREILYPQTFPAIR